MRYPKPDTVNRRLVENVLLSQKVRLAALNSIARPPLALLLRLLKNAATPSRLVALAAEKYQKAILRRTPVRDEVAGLLGIPKGVLRSIRDRGL